MENVSIGLLIFFKTETDEIRRGNVDTTYTSGYIWQDEKCPQRDTAYSANIFQWLKRQKSENTTTDTCGIIFIFFIRVGEPETAAAWPFRGKLFLISYNFNNSNLFITVNIIIIFRLKQNIVWWCELRVFHSYKILV